MAHRHGRLVIDLLSVTIICGVLSATDNVVIRSLASIPLIFFLPGSAILRVLRWQQIMPLQRATFEVGLSIAVTILSGFLLNAVSQLNQLGWEIWLCAVVLITSFIAAARGDAPLPVVPCLDQPRTGTVFVSVLVSALAMMITAGTFLWKIQADDSFHPFRFTEFWMVPVFQGDSGAFTIGVTNEEGEVHDFDIEVHLEGTTLAVWRDLRLEPGGTLTETITVPPGADRERRLTAWLLNSNYPSVIYRQASAVLAGHAVGSDGEGL
jgi:uncharacterized membrane protein